jgi:hypothetical protein
MRPLTAAGSRKRASSLCFLNSELSHSHPAAGTRIFHGCLVCCRSCLQLLLRCFSPAGQQGAQETSQGVEPS